MNAPYPMDEIWTWDIARENCTRNRINPTEETYRVAGKRQILPHADTIQLPTSLAEELYESGKASLPIEHTTVPLPVFELGMWVDADCEDTDICKLLQPLNPYRDDLYVYGLDALFVANDPIMDTRFFSNHVTCLLTLYDSNDSSAGVTDVAIFTFVDKGEHFVKILPYWRDADADWLCDNMQLERIALWLGFLWRGIQLRLLNRPELIRERHTRIPSNEVREVRKSARNRARIVKVVREITILSEKETATKTKREITLSCWGIAGHWRVYKTGKRIWIKSYLKGKDRDKAGGYSAKEYEIVKEAPACEN